MVGNKFSQIYHFLLYIPWAQLPQGSSIKSLVKNDVINYIKKKHEVFTQYH